MHTLIQRAAVGVLSLVCTAVASRAQCTNNWRPGLGIPGVYGDVWTSTIWDRDGVGPASPVLAIGGNFRLAGDAACNGVATWDPATGTWARLGTGMAKLSGDPTTYSLTVFNGDLIAGGDFDTADGVAAPGIARFPAGGTAWQAMTTGMTASGGKRVRALAVFNGQLIAAGNFSSVSGVFVTNIARFNGTTWLAMGSGLNLEAYSLVSLSSGTLVAGGAFNSAGGVSVGNLASWDGASWSAVSSPGANGNVFVLREAANGDILAGGSFTSVGGVTAGRLARFNGTTWSALGGTGMSANVYEIRERSNGNLVVGGDFTSANGVSANRICEVVGATCSALGSGMAPAPASFANVRAVFLTSTGDIVAGGRFVTAGGNRARSIARWNGSAWSVMAGGVDYLVNAVLGLRNGDLLIAGDFTAIGGVAANRIARFNGTTFTPLGSGLNNSVNCVIELANGDIVVGGTFTTAGGVGADRLARFNGSAWSGFGSSFSNSAIVNAVAELANGDIIVGGVFGSIGGVATSNICRFTGTTPSAVSPDVTLPGVGGFISQVNALATSPGTNSFFVGGNFTAAGGPTNGTSIGAANIVFFNSALTPPRFQRMGGTASDPTPGANLPVHALAVAPNGALIAGGEFTLVSGTTTGSGISANRVASFSGGAWSAMGSGFTGGTLPEVDALTVHPNGSVFAGGLFTTSGSTTVNNIARFDGTNWIAMGTGVGGLTGLGNATVRSLSPMLNGDITAGGWFITANDAASAYLATFTTTCPATAPVINAGCGPTFRTVQQAYLNTTFRADVAVNALTPLGVGIWGNAEIGPVDLSTLFPEGVPGCLIRAQGDLLTTLTNTGNVLPSTLTIPATTTLIGAVFFHQVMPFEFNSSGTLVAIRVTDELRVTVGSF